MLVCTGAFEAPAQATHEMEVLKRHTKEKVKQLNDYLLYIANPQKDIKTRLYYIGEAQKLFINNCEPFDVVQENNDGSRDTIRREGAQMEYVPVIGKSRQISIKKYLVGLVKGKYKPVKIEYVEFVSNYKILESQPPVNSTHPVACLVFNLVLNDSSHNKTRTFDKNKWYIGQLKSPEVIDTETKETYFEYATCIGDIKGIIE